MQNDRLPPIQRGDPLKVEPINRMVERLNRQHTGINYSSCKVGTAFYRQSHADLETENVLIRNDTNENRLAYEILGIDGCIYDPVVPAELASFQTDRILIGVVPVFPEHDGKFAILMENLAAGEIGPCRVSGLFVCKVTWPADARRWYGFADISENYDPDNTEACTGLVALPKGKAKILVPRSYCECGIGTTPDTSGFMYKEGEDVYDMDSLWCIVNLGNHNADISFWGKAREEIDPGSTGIVDLWKDTDQDGIPDAIYEESACRCSRYVTAIGAINTPIPVPADPDWCSVTWMTCNRRWWAVGCPNNAGT